MLNEWHAPLDPDCPTNPIGPNSGFWDDPMTIESGCGDEIAADLEQRHRRSCSRCQEYGAANIEGTGAMMRVDFHGWVELERQSGKFESKDSAAGELESELDGVIGAFQFTGDNGGEYEVSDYELTVR